MTFIFDEPNSSNEIPSTVFVSLRIVDHITSNRGTAEESTLEFFDPETGVVGVCFVFSSEEAALAAFPRDEVWPISREEGGEDAGD